MSCITVFLAAGRRGVVSRCSRMVNNCGLMLMTIPPGPDRLPTGAMALRLDGHFGQHY
jgi:hypothetical protein